MDGSACGQRIQTYKIASQRLLDGKIADERRHMADLLQTLLAGVLRESFEFFIVVSVGRFENKSEN